MVLRRPKLSVQFDIVIRARMRLRLGIIHLKNNFTTGIDRRRRTSSLSDRNATTKKTQCEKHSRQHIFSVTTVPEFPPSGTITKT
jgi:hypothetical protein